MWLLVNDLYGFLTRGPIKKHDGVVGVALLEAFAGQFIYFSENDVRPRHFQEAGSRARGEGRERGNLQITTLKPPVAQRAGVISTKKCKTYNLLN